MAMNIRTRFSLIICGAFSVIIVVASREAVTINLTMTQIFNLSNVSGPFCTIFWPYSESQMESPQWISQLPFPCQVWSTFDSSLDVLLKKRTALNGKVVTIVPMSRKDHGTGILRMVRKKLFPLYYVLPLFPHCIRDKTLKMRQPPDLSVPREDGSNCSLILLTSAKELFRCPRVLSWAVMRNETFIVGVRYQDVKRGLNYSHRVYSHAKTLLKVLSHLNITISPHTVVENDPDGEAVVMDLVKNKMDIFSFPWSISEYRGTWLDTGGFIDNSYIKFFSKRGVFQSPSIRLHVSLWQLLVAVIAAAVIVLIVYYVQGRLFGRSARTADAAIFLYAGVLGISSNSPSSSQYFTTRILCYIWFLGMFFLCAQIKSELTSETSIPTFSRGVETTRELQKLAELKKVLPCVEPNLLVCKLLLSSQTGLLGKLGELLKTCGSDCTGNSVDRNCSIKTHQGTHVYITLLGDYMISSPASKLSTNLAPAKDNLGFFPSAFFVSKSFPYRRQFRNLVMAIFESGLSKASLRTELPPQGDMSVNVPNLDFSRGLFIYCCGCFAAILVALLELLTKIYLKINLS